MATPPFLLIPASTHPTNSSRRRDLSALGLVVTPVAGSERDGVRVYAERLACARAASGRPTQVCEITDRVVDADVLHLHLNDRWWLGWIGDYRRWLAGARRTGARVVMTLHDIPDPHEGAERYARRCALYRALAARADVVIVSSEHERARASALDIDALAMFHPAFAPRHERPSPASVTRRRHGRVGVLGHVHPGKGHLELIDALGAGRSHRSLELRVIGASPPEHCDHLDELRSRALRLGVSLSVTGTVSTTRWRREIAATAVPVAAHRHVSASGSVLDWVAHGRRPLVSRNGFTTELAALAPDAVTVVDGDWADAIERAVDDPASTDLAALPDALQPHVAVERFESILRA